MVPSMLSYMALLARGDISALQPNFSSYNTKSRHLRCSDVVTSKLHLLRTRDLPIQVMATGAKRRMERNASTGKGAQGKLGTRTSRNMEIINHCNNMG